MTSAHFVLAVIVVHLSAALVIAGLGAHRLHLARLYLRHRRGQPTPPTAISWPTVTVQIPVYNERYVADRVIRAVGDLCYPLAKLEVQVLDDSTDDTRDIVAAAVSALRIRGIAVEHLHRRRRDGFKAGALDAGLRRAMGDLVAIFDADFVPGPDFLVLVVPEFQDPRVGMVQTRWSHLNAEMSPLTRAQALQLDAHFIVEHGARAATGRFFNFNGTAGVWRKAAIVDAGGWRHNTLTEDLDLSYRAQLSGWRFVYRGDVTVPGELPVEIAAYRAQQERWAQGAIRTARRVLPILLRAPLPSAIKTEAVWHLLQHLAFPAIFLLALTGPAIVMIHPAWLRDAVLAAHGILLTAATACVFTHYAVAARAGGGAHWKRRLFAVPVIIALGTAMAFPLTLAVLRGTCRGPTPFHRTPKYRLGSKRDSRWRCATYRLPARALLTDGLAGLACLVAATAFMSPDSVGPNLALLILGSASLTLGVAAVAQSVRPRPRRLAPQPAGPTSSPLPAVGPGAPVS